MSAGFKLAAPFEPAGDQGAAIERLVREFEQGVYAQTLLGVTGSGKTFTVAKVIERLNRPTLVLSHNKTLAAQLFQEFKGFFPENAVEYFVSYYDYYQPEAYVPSSDTYIEKETSINEEIDRLRLSATRALFERRDVLIVASVSCIYGLGDPNAYYGMLLLLEPGSEPGMDAVLRQLVAMQYERTMLDLVPGAFRVRGDVLEIYPPYDDHAVRVEFWDRSVERIRRIDPIRGTVLEEVDSRLAVYPASHYVVTPPRDRRGARGHPGRARRAHEGAERRGQAARGAAALAAHACSTSTCCRSWATATGSRTTRATSRGASRASRRRRCSTTSRRTGCSWSTSPTCRSRRCAACTTATARARRRSSSSASGSRRRSTTARSPSRSSKDASTRSLFVSATPGPYELEHTEGEVVEQLIRPTGLLDPQIVVKPAQGQVDDLLARIRERVAAGERVLVTTLTKRMAEDLTQYYAELGVRVRYLHSEVEALERTAILADLRRGDVRRAGRDQPPARGARPPGGVAGRHPRRRQGGLPAQRDVAGPDDRARRAQRQRHGDPVRGPDDRLADEGDRRNQPAAGGAGGVQPRARHRAEDDHQGHREPAAAALEPRLPRRGVPAAEGRRGGRDRPGVAREGDHASSRSR